MESVVAGFEAFHRLIGGAAMVDSAFWAGKRVFVTGHTGFKGSWLSLWLHELGAQAIGFSNGIPTQPSMYELCRIDSIVESITGDVRDLSCLRAQIQACQPDIVIHMAAQPLVRLSYADPIGTYATNVMGTANLLESVRTCDSVRAVVVVTTDKCYDNKEWVWGYREADRLGGYDPYSSSKACAELVTASYRSSFLNPRDYETHRVAVASARAGNVIGGGDWAADRLIPDCVRALLSGSTIVIRSPGAIRPWQHVLEPLSGYLALAQRLYDEGPAFAEAWNFGPDDSDAQSVLWVVEQLCAAWREDASYEIDGARHPHESTCLRLDCSKARHVLGWRPKWTVADAILKTVEWTKAYRDREDLREVSRRQILEYTAYE